MPQVAPSEYEALPLRAFELAVGFPLHDVWRVDLEGERDQSLPRLRSRLTSTQPASLPFPVRALFSLRAALGRMLRLDARPKGGAPGPGAVVVPETLSSASLVESGTFDGPFRLLYCLENEAVYEARNTTVHALLVVALVQVVTGQTFYWASYVKPVGRVTAIYMALIDPFRRYIVYPGLEAWLKREVAAAI